MYATLTARKVHVTKVTLLFAEMKHAEGQAEKHTQSTKTACSVFSFFAAKQGR